MLRELKEEVQIKPLLEQQVEVPSPPKHEEDEEPEEFPQVDNIAFSDPGPSTRDVSIRGREIGAPISASMGSMRPLVGKLDMLLQAPLLRRCSNSKRFKRVEDGIGLLKDDVQKMGSYLDQLSEVEDPPVAANCWMNEARNLSYDMEDYIDSLIFVGPENPSLVPDNIKATRSGLKFSFCLKFLGHAKSPKTQVVSIAETLSEFRMYVLEAIERHQRYNLHSYSTLKRRLVPVGPTLPIPTQYDEEASHIVIDGWTSKFINSLVDDVGEDQQLKVVSILGPSCLGKTTLANVLYSRIGKQYHCRAFVRVSKKPDMKRIFCDIFSQLQLPDHPWDFKETDLIDSIKKYLQNKRYLIIIDDLWETSVWDLINQAFPKGSQGSRIVTTTQIENVAIACCSYQSEHVFEMQPLDDDHSKKLFFNRLFGSESDCPDELKQVCDEITEICDGLPLATICIASLLLSQPVMSNDLFTYIHQSLISCFSAVPTCERTRQALNLSYNNLPRYLKTCLLYLNMYPEGYTFLKDDLVKQWVAEGLIYATEGQDIEKVAESYLYQLIGRSFIQPISVSYNKEVLSCQVHDMIHDLIAHKSAEENFIVAIDYRCRKNVSLSHKVRRLSLVFGDARYAKTPTNIRNSQVRSVRFSGLLESMPCLTEFKLVRVLNLQLSGQGCHDDDIADLTGISEMFQLRYLKIACDVCIKLPSHVLQYLGTLDITDARLAPVPWDVNFPRLLHLHLSLPVQRDLLDGIDRIRSPSLMSIGKLNNLQELHLTISSLSTFQHVAKNIEALGSLLGGHGNLKTIAVAHASSVINTAASKSNILWDCMEPPPLLQRFEFSPHSSCIFSQVPLWVGKLGNLCILKIAVRELMMNSVDILKGLPALTALSLYVQTPPDDNIIFDTAGFSVLKYFKFTFMRGIACIKFEADAMPNLWKLKLVFNIIPPMDQQLILCSNHPQWKTYGHGTALISIDYMPGLREIFTKFGGAAADLEYVSRTGVISNHPSNPIIDVQLADSGSYADESTETEITSTNEILEERPDEIIKSGSRNTSPGR
ncbi:disease resistance protein RGA5-like [Hordeum vulgare subsp. vulgare]|uniref:NB-ARC domain-containing protein n=1 Tax=Hordeum vulgare subsp. vulgare TaxID=112509 RepID=A0A8I7BHX8_HORVV|nr:disease resistance protein RGA5-like [Hordeum vulgare subsp. vulgare]